MTNQEMARGYLALASTILEGAHSLNEKGAWNLVVRRSQEVVEWTLKGLLRWLGMEIPRTHDVSFLLKQNERRLPDKVRDNLDRIVSISRSLRREREVSFYGDEEAGAPATELYAEEDARQALEKASWVLKLCGDIVPSGPQIHE